jgi:hypothetical protein
VVGEGSYCAVFAVMLSEDITAGNAYSTVPFWTRPGIL